MIDSVLQQFLDRVEPCRGRIREMRLFGSRARGEEKPYSDYDILVIVDRKDAALRKTLYGAVVDVLTATGRVISLKIFPEHEYKRLASIPTPFRS